MTRILEEGVLLAQPTEPELHAWFDEHEARFAAPPLVDFTQVFVAGEGDGAKSRAAELLAALRGGAEPAGMGDPFQGGRRYRHRKIADLATTFGEPFIEGLSEQAVNTWELRSSRHGQHLVRVDSITAGAAPDFETARRDVEKHHRDAKRAEGVAKAMNRLRAEWTVVRE